jgi:alkylmercury lyase
MGFEMAEDETMTVERKVPPVDEYWGKLASFLRPFSLEEQRAAVALYRELAKGSPVHADQLGRALGVSPAESRSLLQREAIKCFAYADDEGRVLGFGGLAATPMHHRFEVQGHTLWTWCAWDSLFIPEILGRAAHVRSADPENGEIVSLVVTPDRVESAVPETTVVSFIEIDAPVFQGSAANVMAKFCHSVFFFSTRLSGERWIAKRPGTFLYGLEEAFGLAKRLNARNFGLELGQHAA